MLQLVQGFQLTCGGDHGMTPATGLLSQVTEEFSFGKTRLTGVEEASEGWTGLISKLLSRLDSFPFISGASVTK